MGIKTFGSGFDPGSGWAPDDSTGIQYEPEVDIPGQFRGGGRGFGLGGFFDNPRLTANPSGPAPGISLSGEGGGGAPIQPDEIISPTNRTIPSGKQVGTWTNPFTNAHINPATGLPELLPESGSGVGVPGIFSRIFGRGAAPAAAAAGAAAINAGITNEREGADAGLINPNGTGPRYSVSNLPLSPNGPLPGPGRSPTGPQPAPLPFHQPDHPSTMRFPGWPTPPAPSAAVPAVVARPGAGGGPGRSPSGPVATPAAADPAAPATAVQRPDLGTYNPFTTLDYRPNSGPNERNRGSPVATALDLSRLFGGGQPAAAPAAATAPPRPRGGILSKPSKQLVEPGTEKRRNLGGGHF